MEPVAGYARLGDERIYYMTIGEGPPDVVINTGSWGSVDTEWEDPGIRLFYGKAAAYGRTILFDRRGTGASDPVPLNALPPWESFVEEVECVMDSVGIEKASILGSADGGPTSMLFAANKPDRVDSLILYCTYSRQLADADYPIGYPQEAAVQQVREMADRWGEPGASALWIPSKAGDLQFQNWHAKVQRSVASPGAALAYALQGLEQDVRAILPTIRVPTLVIHAAHSQVIPVEFGRYIADNIEGAEFVEIDGGDVAPYWEHPDELISIIYGFLSGAESEPTSDRRLATVMFTDIVGSTHQAEKLGDRSWNALLDVHDTTTQRLVDKNNGAVIKTTGDGALATFDGPGRAIQCAAALSQELSQIEISLRTGIHVGEIETRGADVGGVAVNLASRVMSAAAPGEILVSRTVKDLVVGSGIVFSDRGSHHLKGIEGEWQLYSVDAPSLN